MKKTWNLVTGIIAGIFSIILACDIFAFYSTIHMEKFVSKKNIEAVLADMDLSTAIYEIDEVDQVSGYLQMIGIPKETLGEVLETEEVNNLISEYLTSCALYVMFETESPALKGEDLKNAVVKGFEVVGEKTGMPLKEIQKKAIASFVDTYSDVIIESLPTPEQVAQKLDTAAVDQLRGLFSARTKGILLSIAFVFAVLLLLLKRNIGKIIFWFSISSLWTGVFCIFTSSAGKNILMNLYESDALMRQMLSSVGSLAFGSMIKAGILFLAAGVILQLISGVILHRKQKS